MIRREDAEFEFGAGGGVGRVTDRNLLFYRSRGKATSAIRLSVPTNRFQLRVEDAFVFPDGAGRGHGYGVAVDIIVVNLGPMQKLIRI